MFTETNSVALTVDASSVPPAASRLPVLDGLRGLVVLFIPLVHFRSFATGTTPLEHAYLYLGDFSLVALDIFFVLSGFLITGILVDSKGSPSYFRGFYARRTLRIIPLYYGFLLAYFVLLPSIPSPVTADLDLSAAQQSWYWFYLVNVGLGLSRWWHPTGASWAPAAPGTGHLWSLSVEEQFYLVWPVIVSATSSTTMKRVCLACLVAAPALRVILVGMAGETAHVAAYGLTPTRLEGLAIGSLLALRRRQPGGLAGLQRWAPGVAVFTGVGFIAVLASTSHIPTLSAPLVTLGLTASAFLAGAIVLLSLQGSERNLWQKTLRSWPMQQIGQYSYAIYILHYPLWFLLGRANRLTRAQFGALIPTRLGADLAYFIVLTCLSIIVAAFSWHAYEKHFLALKRHFPYVFKQRV